MSWQRVVRALLVTSALLGSAGCESCKKKPHPPAARVTDAATADTRLARRLNTDRNKAELLQLSEVAKAYAVSPAGAIQKWEGELVRVRGVVTDVTPGHVVIQDGDYAGTCEPAPAGATKGQPIEVTGFFGKGGGHIAARIKECELAH